MLTLALDTTTRAGSVAVTRGAAILAVVYGDGTRTHGERLPGELQRALDIAGVAARDLDLLAVASGPGAFTGLRIGLAAIQGLSMVLDLPVVAVSALDALALAAWRPVPDLGDRPPGGGLSPTLGGARVLGVWMDAQRGEVFAAHYLPTGDQNLPTPVSVPIVASPEDALAAMGTEEPAVFIGDGAVRYASQILQQVRATQPVVPRDLVSSPPVPRPVSSTDAATASEEAARPQRDILEPPRALAPFIARLGERLAGRGEAGPPHALQPLYVRRPDAVLERQRRHGA